MPALRQASISSIPKGAVSFFPSTVKVTSAIRLQRPLNYGQLNMFGERAGFSVQVVFKFLAKLFHKADGGHGRRIAQRAESAAHHVFRQVLNVVDVLGRAEAGMESGNRFLQPVRALAAGNAPAAALVLIEANRAERKFDNAGLVVNDY